jgi:hypothetical protein
LTRSIGDMTINTLNESIEKHIDELRKSAKPRKKRSEIVNDSEMVKYLQMSGIQRKTESPGLAPKAACDAAPGVRLDSEEEGEEEEEVRHEIEEKVSSVNDKLYLDIFIPCVN